MDMTTAKPFACKSDGCGLSFTNEDHLTVHEREHEMLHFSLSGQKSGGIFVADQTPTPTRLIKNCEEVGLFDDLRHVNPFDETFRRAVEQNSVVVDASVEIVDPVEESLHTPQVYPHFESNDELAFHHSEQRALDSRDEAIARQIILPDGEPQSSGIKISSKDNTKTQDNSDYLYTTSNSGYGKIQRYRSIAEKPTVIATGGGKCLPTSVELPLSIQLVQPQVITLSFPNNTTDTKTSTAFNNNDSENNVNRKIISGTAIPVQTVKPFILPKLSSSSSLEVESNTTNASTRSVATISPASQPEPSSASLTPTSQLPIKERLKVILSNNSRSRTVELTQKVNSRRSKSEADFMERRRAASTRYRIKIRSVQEDLRRRNEELQSENEKLKERIKQLEVELTAHGQGFLKDVDHQQQLSSCVQLPQIQIPPATVHLIMNIPQMIIPSSGQPIIKKPITFQVEKK